VGDDAAIGARLCCARVYEAILRKECTFGMREKRMGIRTSLSGVEMPNFCDSEVRK
jgi:hypothetical protein